MMRPLLLFVITLAPLGCNSWRPVDEDVDATFTTLVEPLVDQDEGAPGRDFAIGSVEALATRYGSHRESLLASAALNLDRGAPTRSQLYVERALQLDPSDADARYLRARIAVADGNPGLARRIVDEGLVYRPDSYLLWEASAWLWQLEGGWDQARRDLESAAKVGAPAWRVRWNQGLVEESAGNLEAARTHYQACVDSPAADAARQRLRGLQARIR